MKKKLSLYRLPRKNASLFWSPLTSEPDVTST